MILKIYLDVLFLENFLTDYILLLLTGKILQKQKKGMGMLAASLAGSAYTMGYYVWLSWSESGEDIWIRVLWQAGNFAVADLMTRCAYADQTKKQRFTSVFTLTMFAYVTGGFLAWAQEMSAFFRQHRSDLWMAAGALLFSYLFMKKWTEKIREKMFRKKCHLPVLITFGKKKIYCKGLMDSGNSLYEPITKRPVVIVERELLARNHIPMPEGVFAIPYHAIGTQKGILKGVLADELEIPVQQGEQRWHKVMLGIYEGKISPKDEYQVILHPKL